ncbi:MAG: hypothetical protein LBG80_10580 [Bacteroidales bacterium]|jgi:hypothetical protein|nr:hypothetical protein [Bacteroidales bacterium]
MKKVPILFLIFNREDITLQSFASIKEYSPNRLYIAADGPRAEKPGEYNLCEDTRNSVLKAIDWDCEIKKLFRDKNLGCTNAISSAITWFFENEEYGIIIEDDCLIHQDFYRLCEELLPKYRNEEKIMLITAQNHTPDLIHANQLVFTNRAYIWGWASWRRAWDKMDMKLPKYKLITLIKQRGFFAACIIFFYYQSRSRKNPERVLWDGRWSFSVSKNNGLCLSSNVNLSKNIGIEHGGTNYPEGGIDIYAHIPFGKITWPLVLPQKIEPTLKKQLAERKEFYRFCKIGLKKKIKRYLNLCKHSILK